MLCPIPFQIMCLNKFCAFGTGRTNKESCVSLVTSLQIYSLLWFENIHCCVMMPWPKRKHSSPRFCQIRTTPCCNLPSFTGKF
ncbi:hypothetical protein CMV_019461 [Castanea mollissima]|uniref:Uncharacterized protein n=1 Tax=Castanea mollissima TaxID=60419 RepID=A0A8J4QN18_9ROSI|nr:hypothetical protein CMV_019461 [Castanea mollissima]